MQVCVCVCVCVCVRARARVCVCVYLPSQIRVITMQEILEVKEESVEQMWLLLRECLAENI